MPFKVLSIILMKKDSSTGWTSIKHLTPLGNKYHEVIKYLEEKNLIVRKDVHFKLKTVLLEQIVKDFLQQNQN